jgi:general secretion pathway protein D
MGLAQINGIIQISGQSFLSVGAFLHAIQTDSDANILSTPNLLAMDNESAEIIIGENVPILTSTQQVYQTGLVSSPSISRQDVGLKLKLTPQINDSDYVKLNLTTEISKVVESTGGINVNLQGVTTSKRSAQTVVVARDRQTVVIGGLLDDRVTVSESKVPILGDLPILGWLFRSSKKRGLRIFSSSEAGSFLLMISQDSRKLVSGRSFNPAPPPKISLSTLMQM